MTAHPHTAPAGITVEDFILRYLLGDRHSAYPVADRDGSIIGLITLAQLRRVTASQRAESLVREVAIPMPRVPTAAPHEPSTRCWSVWDQTPVTAPSSSTRGNWQALSP